MVKARTVLRTFALDWGKADGTNNILMHYGMLRAEMTTQFWSWTTIDQSTQLFSRSTIGIIRYRYRPDVYRIPNSLSLETKTIGC